MTAKRQLDMLNGPIWNKIPRFALPLAATAILGQLFNAADIAVVGNFTGNMSTAAVAAVSANSSLIGLVVNLFVGISLGANVTIAYAIGQDDGKAVSKAVHTAIVMALLGVCGVRLSWIYWVFPKTPTFQTIMAVFPISLSVTALLMLAAVLRCRPSRRFLAAENSES